MTTPADSPGKGLMNFVVYGLIIILLVAVFAQVVFTITAMLGNQIDPRYLALLQLLAPVVVGTCVITSLLTLLLPPSKLRSNVPKICSLLVVIQVILWAAS